MRILIISLFGFLAACNGTTIQQVPSNVPNESTQVAALQAQVIALQKQIDSLQIIGKVSGKSEDTDNTRALTTNFGPCSNMGVLVGFTNGTNSADPLTSDFQAFKQCTGYQYEVGVGTGIIATAERIFWDGPNCTGNILEWQAGGVGYNTQTLQGGVVFLSPVDNSELMVQAGQNPQPIMIQSVWVNSNPGCQADVETQMMYQVSPNDTSISGVPNSVSASYQLGAP